MTMTEDAATLRMREALEALGEDAQPGPDCADEARIWAAVRGELPAAESHALLDHALACPSCGTAWRVARSFAAEADAEDRSRSVAPVAVPGLRGWTWGHWAAVAALVIAAVLLPVGVHEWRAPRTPTYREPAALAIEPLVAEGSSLSREAFRLRWTAGPPGTRYSVRVVRTDLSVLAEADALDSDQYEVPADLLRDVPPGTLLYWRVEAHLPDGSHVMSDTFSVRLE